MNLFKEISRSDSDKPEHSLTFLPLPVSDEQSGNRNLFRRINSSKESTSHFMKLTIILSETVRFELTVSKSISFEGLACNIEADYYLKTGILVTCCILASEDWTPYHLDWMIESHLNSDSIVRVFNYTDSKKSINLLQVNQKEYGLSRLNPKIISDNDFAEVLQYIFNNQQLDHKFYDFLISSYSLENMFFFLDMHAFKKRFFSPEIYRVYLGLIYIMPNAPLLLNVDSEVKRHILSKLNGAKGVDSSIFDDAFHEVSWSLKLVTDSFLKKYPLPEIIQTEAKNPFFRLNVKETTSIMEIILTESNVKIGKVNDKSISGFLASVTTLNKLTIDRHLILTKVQNRFYSNKKEFDSMSSYFFDNCIDKTLLVEKSYKLKKKFGYSYLINLKNSEQPSQKDLLKQISQISKDPINILDDEAKKNSDDDEMDEMDHKAHMVKRSNRLQSFFGENVAAHLIKKQSVDSPQKKTNEELDGIRKKWTKLQSYLGEKIPLKVMIAQKPSRQSSEVDAKQNQNDLFYTYQTTLQAMSSAIDDASQLVEILHTFGSLDAQRDAQPETQIIPKRRVSIEVDFDTIMKNGAAQSEKRIIKLENFFGPDIGARALLGQIEVQIMSDLEALILNDIIDLEKKQILTSDIEKARAKIHSKINVLSAHCKIVE